MNKAKLRWILTLMVCIAAISAFSAEVPYSTELNGKDEARIEKCREAINSAMANLTGEDLKRANRIIEGIMIELTMDQVAHKGLRKVGGDKKCIADFATLTAETLTKSKRPMEACGGLGKYFYDKGHKDYVEDQKSKGTKGLAHTINDAIFKALGSQTRRGWYNVGYKEAMTPDSLNKTKNVDE